MHQSRAPGEEFTPPPGLQKAGGVSGGHKGLCPGPGAILGAPLPATGHPLCLPIQAQGEGSDPRGGDALPPLPHPQLWGAPPHLQHHLRRFAPQQCTQGGSG